MDSKVSRGGVVEVFTSMPTCPGLGIHVCQEMAQCIDEEELLRIKYSQNCMAMISERG